ncbi:translation initiation factor IF-6 [Candidatus Altiarchaeota archaeon]
MHYESKRVQGEDFIGLLGLATDKYSILSQSFPKTHALDVPSSRTMIYDTNLTGMFCAGNSNGLLVPYFVKDDELRKLERFLNPLGAEVARMEDRHTALGNMISANDNACIHSPNILGYTALEDTLGVEAVSMSVGGHEESGACLVATNKGFIATPDAEGQVKELEDILKVPGDVGTVNFGVIFPKSGLIANSNGYIVGERTSGIELGEIDDALGFID